ncbi:hypothetical protein I4F81_003673 [Pyropia yezoensis]|uniref:Uncharacterized protein n=1 Tax=Pyropia yezoensis TaxID=2788 RepID=A0ACC3BT06_PYRYE|nr:hypothetical protein I4F81_003673 [Neopyropia yezoensis]
MPGLCGPVIGIDLGTTFSVAAKWNPTTGQAIIIRDSVGRATIPSVVSFTDEEMLVGTKATSKMSSKGVDTVTCVKRLMGLPWDHPHVQREVANSRCKIVAEVDGDGKRSPVVEVTFKKEVRRFRPEQISAFILSHVLKVAQDKIGDPVVGVAVTVPAHFSVEQREATRKAVMMAVPPVVFIGFLNEPTAAAIAHGYMEWAGVDKNTIMPAKVAGVVDFGGGTFDVTMLKVGVSLGDDGTRDPYVAAISTEGDPYLGGEDVDRILADKVKDQIRKELKDVPITARRAARVLAACTAAKAVLSDSVSADISVPTVVDADDNDFAMTIRRTEMNDWCRAPVYDRAVAVVKKAVRAAQAKHRDRRNDGLCRDTGGNLVIHEFILVGGSSRIPGFQAVLTEAFPDVKLSVRLDADEAVAAGAAAHAWELSRDHDTGPVSRLTLMDVTSSRLGVEVNTGEIVTVVEKNQNLPASSTRVFNGYNRKTSVRFSVYEGDAEWVSDTKHARLLGEFLFVLTPKEPGVVPKAEVTFKMNTSGELSVLVRDLLDSGPATHQLTVSDTIRKIDERKLLQLMAENRAIEDGVRARARWMMAKESLLGAVDRIRLASVQNVVVSARLSVATRAEINRLLEDSVSYAAAARMDSVHISDFTSRKIDLVAKVGRVMSDKGERVVSPSTECMDETTDDAGAGAEQAARREPPEAEPPDGGGGAGGRAKQAARREPPEAEDEGSDRPSKRARHSGDQPSRNPGSSNSSVPATESEHDDSSGGARSSSDGEEEDKD